MGLVCFHWRFEDTGLNPGLYIYVVYCVYLYSLQCYRQQAIYVGPVYVSYVLHLYVQTICNITAYVVSTVYPVRTHFGNTSHPHNS